MPKLPSVSGQAAVRAFERLGWYVSHQTGSHIVLKKPGFPANLSIPNHKTLGPGLLRGLIRTARVSVADLVEALKD